MKRAKREIITFKANETLLRALEGVRNRSAFIREAVQAALDGTCPLCRGSGALTPNQKQHWDAFAADHAVARCGDCEETHLVCGEQPPARVHS